MIALDNYYNEGILSFCSICGDNRYCGTGHQEPRYMRRFAPMLYYRAAAKPGPTSAEHPFRASALGRRYIPVALDLAALPLGVVDPPWVRPFTPMRPVRARCATRARSIAPVRSRPGRRRRAKAR